MAAYLILFVFRKIGCKQLISCLQFYFIILSFAHKHLNNFKQSHLFLNHSEPARWNFCYRLTSQINLKMNIWLCFCSKCYCSKLRKNCFKWGLYFLFHFHKNCFPFLFAYHLFFHYQSQCWMNCSFFLYHFLHFKNLINPCFFRVLPT